jgi:hypothetical protein
MEIPNGYMLSRTRCSTTAKLDGIPPMPLICARLVDAETCNNDWLPAVMAEMTIEPSPNGNKGCWVLNVTLAIILG